MKRTLKRDWQRVRMADGKLYYWTHISEYIVTQVWRDGGFWRWAVLGFTLPDGSNYRQPFIWKHGTADTMNESEWYAERAIPDDSDEQLMMLLP